MRAGGGREHAAEDERQQRGRGDERTAPDHLRQPFFRTAALERESLDGDDDARRKHRQREEEVRHHEPRVQARVDGEGAQRRLRERPEERREGEPPHPPGQAGCEAGADPRDERGENRESAHEAVSELDERVVALARQRVARRAARPVLAPEAGVRQANGRAGDDDQPEPERRGERESPEGVGRELDRAGAREQGRRLDVHPPSVARSKLRLRLRLRLRLAPRGRARAAPARPRGRADGPLSRAAPPE